MIQITSTLNQRLDMAAFRLTPRLEKWWKSTIALPNSIGLVSIHLNLRLMLRIKISAKIKTLKQTFSKLVPRLSVIDAKIMSMLLPTVQAHLRLPSMMEFPLKHQSLIALFLWDSLLWLGSLVFFFSCHGYSLLLSQVSSTLFLPRLSVNIAFSAYSTTDPYCHYMFWSPTSSSFTVVTIFFFLLAYVKY